MDLLRLLQQIAQNQSRIRLLNIYKGLPISYDTNILSVGASEIQVPGSKSHIACLYYQGESYVQGDELPFIIRSKVKALNLAQDYAVLSGFEVIQNNIGKRSQIRVEPDELLAASIQFKGSAYDFMAPIVDISTNGASVFFESYAFPARLALPGNDLTMTITIPDFVSRKIKKNTQRLVSENRRTSPLMSNLLAGQDGQIVISASGKVISVRLETDQRRYRMRSQLFFKDLSRMVIVQYISHRQTEIIKDLRVLAEDLYNRKR